MGINMRKLLNTLYITSEDAYLSLNGECVVIAINKTEKHMVPLHTLQSIVCFSYAGASPALMGKCAEKEIMISFFSPTGKYLASSFGNTNGNVFLRHEQYRIADDVTRALVYAKNFVFSKLYNARYFLLKFCRDYPLRIDVERVRTSAEQLKLCLTDAQKAGSADTLRGIEGSAASAYFDSFNELILQNQSFFRFRNRSRRPPLDRTNALLSFAYTLLANDCAAALHGVGLDPYVGFMHTERSGRKSLALDLMEELRTIYADRFVVTLINNRMISVNDFDEQESGAVLLNDAGRRRFLTEWQKRKRDTLIHPFLEEKVSWGLIPHIQALLLARSVRRDLDQYPPFFWK